MSILSLDDGRQAPGVVCVANETRFDAAHYSEPLTAFSAGWRDPEDLRGLLDFLAPPVPVTRRFEFKRATNAEAFYSELDDVRATGSSFKRVEYVGETVQSKTHNKGLTIRVDHDEEIGPDWQERYVALLIQRLLRNEVRRAIAALDSADTAESKTWDSSANPDADLRAALNLAAGSSGIRPNRIALGETAWEFRQAAYDAQNNAGANRSAGLTPNELAQKLFVDEVRLLSSRYQSAASAKSLVLGDAAYLFYAMDGQHRDEPSNLKRFVTPIEGQPFRVYAEAHTKFTDLTVEHYSNLIITSTVGIRKLSVADS